VSRAFPVQVEVTADGHYVLHWTEEFGDGGVSVRAHTDPSAASRVEPLLRDARAGVRVELPPGERHYFHLEPARGEPLTAAQRDVPLEGGTNFRDLGGYRARDGRRVRWGRLYRSGHTAGLSARDQELLASLGIRVCCDFRRDEERQIEPTRLPASTRIVGLAIDPGSLSSFFGQIASGQATPEDMAAFMEHINRDFVHNHTGQFRRMFEELLELEDGGFMINCAAGKDRTGFGAAMILAALGVDEATILEDYLLSARYFPIERELARVQRKYGGAAGERFDVAMILPMMETREEYLRAALDTIQRDFGGLENYLEQMLGIGSAERDALRERFTV
jgi:protein-tyrosine phosphatase